MNALHLPIRILAPVLGLSVCSSACIITTTGGGDPGGSASGTTNASAASDSDTPVDTQGDSNTPSSDTGGDDSSGGGVCDSSENLVLDPGFEAGVPNGFWDSASTQFGTPICDALCNNADGDAAPYMGDWWAWFGGTNAGDGPEAARVEQSILVNASSMAELSFWFQIRNGAGTGDDIFSVELVDGEISDTIFMVTDLDLPDYEGGYSRVALDISDWADGGTYVLRFSAEITGTGLTSFFVDDVRLASCSDDGATDSGAETVGQDETAGDTQADGTTGGSGTTDGGSGTTDGGSGSTEGGSGTTDGGSGSTGGSSRGMLESRR